MTNTAHTTPPVIIEEVSLPPEAYDEIVSLIAWLDKVPKLSSKHVAPCPEQTAAIAAHAGMLMQRSPQYAELRRCSFSLEVLPPSCLLARFTSNGVETTRVVRRKM